MNLHRDASGRLTASVDAEPRAAERLAARVIERFRLEPWSSGTTSPDVTFREFSDGEHAVCLEWDRWTGFQVVASTPSAEPLVEAIVRFVAAIRV